MTDPLNPQGMNRYAYVQNNPLMFTDPSGFEGSKDADPYRNGLKRKGDEIWDWDNLHNDIEVYDKRGRHLGSRNPTTGEM